MTTHLVQYKGVLSDAIMGSQNFRDIYEHIQYSMEVRREPTDRKLTEVARIYRDTDGNTTEVDVLRMGTASEWLVWTGSAAQIRTTDVLYSLDRSRQAQTITDQSWEDRKL